jgi:hypothetical protein
MAERRVEEYAHKHGLSNRQAKKRMRSRRKKKEEWRPSYGTPVAGTGKPKGGSKT